MEVFVAVAGRSAGQARGPVELVRDLAKRLDPVRAGVLHLADLVPDNPVKRHRTILLDEIGLKRLGHPAKVLIVDHVDVSRAQQRPGALVLGAHDHAELQVLGVLPLHRLLPPDQPDDADRGHNDYTPQEARAQQMRNRSERDDGLAQAHVQPQHRGRVGALKVDRLLLVGVE